VIEVFCKPVERKEPEAESVSTGPRRLKYESCKNWREKGECKYGDKCLFAHGDKELTKRGSA